MLGFTCRKRIFYAANLIYPVVTLASISVTEFITRRRSYDTTAYDVTELMVEHNFVLNTDLRGLYVTRTRMRMA
jgi:hypothetical protein